MASGQWAVVLRHVQRLFQGGSVSGLTEGQLLERFVSGRDEVAFGALVARHGPMVLGVCRGVLDDPNDVEDAFQATFLVLVRKAAGLRDRDLLGQWLYGVARRVALRARSDAVRRKWREGKEIGPDSGGASTFDAELRELQTLVREEVDRLPSNDRMAVVLCYLEGMTHQEAADRLGWPVGTVKGRLSRARDRLRDRLTRRGVALPSALAATLPGAASSVVPPSLIASTTLAASQLAAGQALTAGVASAHAISLMEGVIGTMISTKLKMGAAALVATCAVAVPGVLAYQVPGAGGGSAPKAGSQAPPGRGTGFEARPGRRAPVVNIQGALVGGDVSQKREAEARVAQDALKLLEDVVAKGPVTSLPPDAYYRWSRRLVEAHSGPGVAPHERMDATRLHLERMRKLSKQANDIANRDVIGNLEVFEAQYRLTEAERWFLEAVTSPAAPQSGPLPAGGLEGGGGLVRKAVPPVVESEADQKRNKVILAKLEERISMNFPNDTPLEDIKKYIENSTQDEAVGLPTGIPIYVDPQGLQDADKTMASTVSINLEGIPLRTTLRLLLRQLGLVYRVEGGLLRITSEEEEAAPGRPEAGGAGNKGARFQ